MKAEVTITTRLADNEVIVENDKGMIWRYEIHKPKPDMSTAAAVAYIAAGQLAGTITAQLLSMDEPFVKYKLELLTGAECR